jgi:malate dehydrogenase (oxaloacetate-decarboxylating)
MADHGGNSDALIYPGLGFGAMCTQSRKVTDEMIITAAKRLASLSPALADPDEALLPDFADAPSVNFEIAVAVAEHSIEEGVAGVNWTVEEARAKVKEMRWQPVYGRYVYDVNGES